MRHASILSRREFLKIAAVHLASAAVPLDIGPSVDSYAAAKIFWPKFSPETLPYQAQRILHRIPDTVLDSQGYLVVRDPDRKSLGRIPLARTLWNQENSQVYDRLDEARPWAIVLHWYGDKEGFDHSVKGYLRGFDSLRKVSDYITRTSAHYLVTGAELITGEVEYDAEPPGILQTQAPDQGGIPFVASHIQNSYYPEEGSREQYFVRALYQLGYAHPGIDSILLDFAENPRLDANNQSIAIEIAGWDFEKDEHFPSDQTIANTVSLIWALIRRYKISPLNLLGHHEIQLSKADPGKKFLSLIRFLIGAKALVDDDPEMKRAVFGPFLTVGTSPEQAIAAYFKFTRDYLSLVAPQRSVYQWEGLTGYWLLADRLQNADTAFPLARRFCLPLENIPVFSQRLYLQPEPHEGLDLSEHASAAQRRSGFQAVRLVGSGECLRVSEVPGVCRGKTAVFRHRQEDGAEMLSIYSHLEQFGEIKEGKHYPEGFPVGHVRQDYFHSGSYLHIAMAYRATWDLNPKDTFIPPSYAGSIWVRDRFADPSVYLEQRISGNKTQNLDHDSPARYPR